MIALQPFDLEDGSPVRMQMDNGAIEPYHIVGTKVIYDGKGKCRGVRVCFAPNEGPNPWKEKQEAILGRRLD